MGHLLINIGRLPLFKRFILYQHLFPSPRNIELVKEMSAAPPVLVWRNAYDWTVSMAEWLPKRGRAPWGVPSDKSIADGLGDRAGDQMQGAFQYVIDYELPLYIRFLTGWQMVSTDRMPIVFVRFSQVTTAPNECLASLTEKGWKLRVQDIPEDEKASNFNVGIPGRGKKLLSQSQMDQIEALCRNSPVPWVLEEG